MAEFPRVGFFSKGYDCGQVDAFFEDARRAYEGGVPPEQFSAEQVRLATFELKNRGYQIEAVDGAMNRLEAAFINRDRADSVAAEGEAAWYDRVADRATTLYPRLQRPRGERFSNPTSGRGYSCEEVDDLLDRIAGMAGIEGLGDLGRDEAEGHSVLLGIDVLPLAVGGEIYFCTIGESYLVGRGHKVAILLDEDGVTASEVLGHELLCSLREFSELDDAVVVCSESRH